MSRPTKTQLPGILNSIEGFTGKVVFYAWPEKQAPALPYIVYIYPDEGGLGADNVNYKPITSVQVELYTKTKDTDSEARIEATLTANSIYYTKDSTYLDDQKAWMTVYFFEVI